MTIPILTERNDLFEPNIYIQFLVTLKGNPTVEQLTCAISAAYEANESTMSKIVLEKNGSAYYKKMNHTGCKISVEHQSWQTILQENERSPFQLSEGELMRTFILPQDENVQLFIMAHHLVGDGKSITFFIEDILTALSGKELAFKPLEPLTQEMLSHVPSLPLKIKLFVRIMNHKWKRSRTSFSWDDYVKIHTHYWKTHKSHIVYKTFSCEELKQMKENAKSLNISINSYIITALSKLHPKASVIGIPVNIRTSTRTMANLVSGICITHRYDSMQTFQKNAIDVHKKIHAELTPAKIWFVLRFYEALAPTLNDSVLLSAHDCYDNELSAKLADITGFTGTQTRDIGVTNLTKLDIPVQYGEYNIDNILFIPPAVSYSKNNFGISTINNRLTISYRCMESEKEAQARELLEQIAKILTV